MRQLGFAADGDPRRESVPDWRFQAHAPSSPHVPDTFCERKNTLNTIALQSDSIQLITNWYRTFES